MEAEEDSEGCKLALGISLARVVADTWLVSVGMALDRGVGVEPRIEEDVGAVEAVAGAPVAVPGSPGVCVELPPPKPPGVAVPTGLGVLVAAIIVAEPMGVAVEIL